MKNLKRYVPIIAGILVVLGVSLDQYGIDLRSLAGGGSAGTESSSGVDPRTGSSSDTLSSTTGSNTSSTGGVSADLPHWSDTRPNINLWHVFHGEINRSGKPVGFHSRPGGLDPANARLVSVRDGPNRQGVYTANIEVRDGGQWKGKFSSFFPDTLSENQVIDAILHAYRNSNNPDAQPFEGPSGHGFRIQGYTSSRGGINTAYPLYVRD